MSHGGYMCRIIIVVYNILRFLTVYWTYKRQWMANSLTNCIQCWCSICLLQTRTPMFSVYRCRSPFGSINDRTCPLCDTQNPIEIEERPIGSHRLPPGGSRGSLINMVIVTAECIQAGKPIINLPTTPLCYKLTMLLRHTYTRSVKPGIISRITLI